MAVRVSHLITPLSVTCSIAKNRNAKGYSPTALSENPVTSCAPTSIDQKSELGNPDLSTVIENESQDIRGVLKILPSKLIVVYTLYV